MLIFHVPFWDGNSWTVTKEQANHIKVRRTRDGDEVCLLNGHGKWQKGILAQGKTRIDLGEMGASEKPKFRTCLAFAWSRPGTMEWIVEKAVELGITDIMPVLSDHVGSSPSDEQIEKRMKRFEAVAESALCQCEGHFLPVIHKPTSLDQLFADDADIVWVVLDPLGDDPAGMPVGDVGMLVGPEGGWSKSEYEMMLHKTQYAWSISDRILRVETAAVASMVLMTIKGAQV